MGFWYVPSGSTFVECDFDILEDSTLAFSDVGELKIYLSLYIPHTHIVITYIFAEPQPIHHYSH